MAYLAVSKGGYEYIFEVKPFRTLGDTWDVAQPYSGFRIPKGSIKKLIGRKLTWEDEPVELKEE